MNKTTNTKHNTHTTTTTTTTTTNNNNNNDNWPADPSPGGGGHARRAASFRKSATAKNRWHWIAGSLPNWGESLLCNAAPRTAASFQQFNLEKRARPLGDSNFQRAVWSEHKQWFWEFRPLNLKSRKWKLWEPTLRSIRLPRPAGSDENLNVLLKSIKLSCFLDPPFRGTVNTVEFRRGSNHAGAWLPLLVLHAWCRLLPLLAGRGAWS